MRLKFTYARGGTSAVDLVVEFDAQATVGQLACQLAESDPDGTTVSGTMTLVLAGERSRLLDPGLAVAESGLASGDRVSLAAAPRSFQGTTPEHDAVAKLTVIAGPDRGREFLLAPGSAVVGREDSCAVRLTDPMVSRRHARINVGETIEVIDQGSANGIQVGITTTQRATLRGGDVLTLGDTALALTQLQHAQRTSGTVEFVRPARVVPHYNGREFEAPAPPERRAAPRFPTIALVLPLIMGGVLFATTHQVASIIFVALSPMMLIGNAIEGRIVGKREFRKAVEAFRSDLAAMVTDVRAELSEEVRARLIEHPSTSECADAVRERSELLWSRRPDLDRFGHLRLGLGRRASRSTITLSPKSKAPYELIQEAGRAAAALRDVDGVPIVADLNDGALGVAGPRAGMLAEARSLVAQTCALHSPTEFVLAAILGPESAADWDHLKWLPHTSSAQSPLTGRHLVTDQEGVAVLLTELEALVEDRIGDESQRMPRVLVLVESGAPVAHNRMVHVAELGAAVGVHVLWLAPDRSLLPAVCKTFVEVPPLANDARVGYVIEGESVAPVLLEDLAAADAANLAHALAPVEDLTARAEDDSDLPRSISQFATLQDTTLAFRAESVLERWQETNSILTGPFAPAEIPRKAGSLRAVVGMSATGAHALDLRSDGPHALVGGSTNSGKSELLQAWILALAATHSPERVNFLLVDYKGGSAFGDCAALPHTIGLITDLSQHMVRRALTSLAAELNYRERLLHEHGAKDLIEMEKHGLPGAPPSLVIVVDEFAALVNEVPEFIDGVVNVAARGRSLGLHLILATQQPSGVIKGSLRANTNLRIALRVVDENDSNDVLGSADAAGFDPHIPGRAMSRSGPKRLVAFQTAYAGGWTSDEPEPAPIRVEELSLATPTVWELPEADGAVSRDRDQTDIKRLVRTIGEANRRAGLTEPRKAWQPVLPNEVDLATLPAIRRDDTLVFGLADDPSTQSRPLVAFRPDREGNLAVYGAGGSGKSTALRSLALAAGLAQRGGPCHVYGLDFGSRALQMLEVLPHVGSIVPGSDHERVMRLLTWLRATVEERKVRYSEINAGTVIEYRERAGRPDEPRLLLLVDNVGAFRQAYETTDRQRYVDMLTAIASEGRGVGVHIAVAANERIGIHTTLSSAIQRRIVMRMPTEDDYSLLDVPVDVLNSQSTPGRAIDAGMEIQVGILGEFGQDAYQADQVKAMAVALERAGVVNAPPVLSLPDEIRLTELVPAPHEVLLGVDSATLTSVGVEARGAFLLTGAPGSGRSTALRTLLESVRLGLPAAELHYFGSRRSPLARLPVWASASYTADDIAERAQELAARITDRADGGPRVVVVAEGAGDLVMSTAEAALQVLVKACITYDQWFVAEGEASTVRSSSGFLALVKSSRRGLALQPDQEQGAYFNTPFPRINRGDFPEGRGLLVGSGRTGVVQVALPDGGG